MIKVEPDYMAMAQTAWPMVNQATSHYGGPLGLLGKVVGLGDAEIKAGIPAWAWGVAGIFLGVGAGFLLRHKIERIVQ